MPLLKGNLHTHTTFSDGRLPVEDVVARYRDLGYDFLAITDHDDRIDDRMLVLSGVEIDYRPLGQHVGKVTGERETLYVLNHPARYSLTVEQTLRRIRAITRDGLPIHAVEITDTGMRIMNELLLRLHVAEKEWLDVLTPAEQQTFIELMGRVQARFQQLQRSFKP